MEQLDSYEILGTTMDEDSQATDLGVLWREAMQEVDQQESKETKQINSIAGPEDILGFGQNLQLLAEEAEKQEESDKNEVLDLKDRRIPEKKFEDPEANKLKSSKTIPSKDLKKKKRDSTGLGEFADEDAKLGSDLESFITSVKTQIQDSQKKEATEKLSRVFFASGDHFNADELQGFDSGTTIRSILSGTPGAPDSGMRDNKHFSDFFSHCFSIDSFNGCLNEDDSSQSSYSVFTAFSAKRFAMTYGKVTKWISSPKSLILGTEFGFLLVCSVTKGKRKAILGSQQICALGKITHLHFLKDSNHDLLLSVHGDNGKCIIWDLNQYKSYMKIDFNTEIANSVGNMLKAVAAKRNEKANPNFPSTVQENPNSLISQTPNESKESSRVIIKSKKSGGKNTTDDSDEESGNFSHFCKTAEEKSTNNEYLQKCYEIVSIRSLSFQEILITIKLKEIPLLRTFLFSLKNVPTYPIMAKVDPLNDKTNNNNPESQANAAAAEIFTSVKTIEIKTEKPKEKTKDSQKAEEETKKEEKQSKNDSGEKTIGNVPVNPRQKKDLIKLEFFSENFPFGNWFLLKNFEQLVDFRIIELKSSALDFKNSQKRNIFSFSSQNTRISLAILLFNDKIIVYGYSHANYSMKLLLFFVFNDSPQKILNPQKVENDQSQKDKNSSIFSKPKIPGEVLPKLAVDEDGSNRIAVFFNTTENSRHLLVFEFEYDSTNDSVFSGILHHINLKGISPGKHDVKGIHFLTFDWLAIFVSEFADNSEFQLQQQILLQQKRMADLPFDQNRRNKKVFVEGKDKTKIIFLELTKNSYKNKLLTNYSSWNMPEIPEGTFDKEEESNKKETKENMKSKDKKSKGDEKKEVIPTKILSSQNPFVFSSQYNVIEADNFNSSNISELEETTVYFRQMLERTSRSFIPSSFGMDGENSSKTIGIDVQRIIDVSENDIFSLRMVHTQKIDMSSFNFDKLSMSENLSAQCFEQDFVGSLQLVPYPQKTVASSVFDNSSSFFGFMLFDGNTFFVIRPPNWKDLISKWMNEGEWEIGFGIAHKWWWELNNQFNFLLNFKMNNLGRTDSASKIGVSNPKDEKQSPQQIIASISEKPQILFDSKSLKLSIDKEILKLGYWVSPETFVSLENLKRIRNELRNFIFPYIYKYSHVVYSLIDSSSFSFSDDNPHSKKLYSNCIKKILYYTLLFSFNNYELEESLNSNSTSNISPQNIVSAAIETEMQQFCENLEALYRISSSYSIQHRHVFLEILTRDFVVHSIIRKIPSSLFIDLFEFLRNKEEFRNLEICCSQVAEFHILKGLESVLIPKWLVSIEWITDPKSIFSYLNCLFKLFCSENDDGNQTKKNSATPVSASDNSFSGSGTSCLNFEYKSGSMNFFSIFLETIKIFCAKQNKMFWNFVDDFQPERKEPENEEQALNAAGTGMDKDIDNGNTFGASTFTTNIDGDTQKTEKPVPKTSQARSNPKFVNPEQRNSIKSFAMVLATKLNQEQIDTISIFCLSYILNLSTSIAAGQSSKVSEEMLELKRKEFNLLISHIFTLDKNQKLISSGHQTQESGGLVKKDVLKNLRENQNQNSSNTESKNANKPNTNSNDRLLNIFADDTTIKNLPKFVYLLVEHKKSVFSYLLSAESSNQSLDIGKYFTEDVLKKIGKKEDLFYYSLEDYALNGGTDEFINRIVKTWTKWIRKQEAYFATIFQKLQDLLQQVRSIGNGSGSAVQSPTASQITQSTFRMSGPGLDYEDLEVEIDSLLTNQKQKEKEKSLLNRFLVKLLNSEKLHNLKIFNDKVEKKRILLEMVATISNLSATKVIVDFKSLLQNSPPDKDTDDLENSVSFVDDYCLQNSGLEIIMRNFGQEFAELEKFSRRIQLFAAQKELSRNPISNSNKLKYLDAVKWVFISYLSVKNEEETLQFFDTFVKENFVGYGNNSSKFLGIDFLSLIFKEYHISKYDFSQRERDTSQSISHEMDRQTAIEYMKIANAAADKLIRESKITSEAGKSAQNDHQSTPLDEQAEENDQKPQVVGQTPEQQEEVQNSEEEATEWEQTESENGSSSSSAGQNIQSEIMVKIRPDQIIHLNNTIIYRFHQAIQKSIQRLVEAEKEKSGSGRSIYDVLRTKKILDKIPIDEDYHIHFLSILKNRYLFSELPIYLKQNASVILGSKKIENFCRIENVAKAIYLELSGKSVEAIKLLKLELKSKIELFDQIVDILTAGCYINSEYFIKNKNKKTSSTLKKYEHSFVSNDQENENDEATDSGDEEFEDDEDLNMKVPQKVTRQEMHSTSVKSIIEAKCSKFQEYLEANPEEFQEFMKQNQYGSPKNATNELYYPSFAEVLSDYCLMDTSNSLLNRSCDANPTLFLLDELEHKRTRVKTPMVTFDPFTGTYSFDPSVVKDSKYIAPETVLTETPTVLVKAMANAAQSMQIPVAVADGDGGKGSRKFTEKISVLALDIVRDIERILEILISNCKKVSETEIIPKKQERIIWCSIIEKLVKRYQSLHIDMDFGTDDTATEHDGKEDDDDDDEGDGEDEDVFEEKNENNKPVENSVTPNKNKENAVNNEPKKNVENQVVKKDQVGEPKEMHETEYGLKSQMNGVKTLVQEFRANPDFSNNPKVKKYLDKLDSVTKQLGYSTETKFDLLQKFNSSNVDTTAKASADTDDSEQKRILKQRIQTMDFAIKKLEQEKEKTIKKLFELQKKMNEKPKPFETSVSRGWKVLITHALIIYSLREMIEYVPVPEIIQSALKACDKADFSIIRNMIVRALDNFIYESSLSERANALLSFDSFQQGCKFIDMKKTGIHPNNGNVCAAPICLLGKNKRKLIKASNDNIRLYTCGHAYHSSCFEAIIEKEMNEGKFEKIPANYYKICPVCHPFSENSQEEEEEEESNNDNDPNKQKSEEGFVFKLPYRLDFESLKTSQSLKTKAENIDAVYSNMENRPQKTLAALSIQEYYSSPEFLSRNPTAASANAGNTNGGNEANSKGMSVKELFGGAAMSATQLTEEEIMNFKKKKQISRICPKNTKPNFPNLPAISSFANELKTDSPLLNPVPLQVSNLTLLPETEEDDL